MQFFFHKYGQQYIANDFQLRIISCNNLFIIIRSILLGFPGVIECREHAPKAINESHLKRK